MQEKSGSYWRQIFFLILRPVYKNYKDTEHYLTDG
jgi:hypothetical protein